MPRQTAGKIAFRFSASHALILLLPIVAAAQTPADEPSLPTIVVTATRSERPAFETAASIDAVSLADPTANTPGINPSEYLAGIPGLIARDRQNYAQDEQISIRGFGARSTFGLPWHCAHCV